jgi:tripartite-type tricarboxylate transporter receptor subunit TctC
MPRTLLRLRALFVTAAGLVAAAALSTVHAQEFPAKPIRMVIAFPAGGPADIVGRHFAERLSALSGQPVIVDNRAGANGAIGADFVAKAPPDGYTLFFTTVGAVAVTPVLNKATPYDPVRDFAPVSLMVNNTLLFVVNPNVPARNAAEFVALAKANPDKMTIASTGVGSLPHLAIALLNSVSGAKFVHVPYKGAAPAINELVGGQVNAFFGDVPALIGHIRAGKIRVIGAAAAKRPALLPDVQTLAEQGVGRIEAPNWYGLFAPAKTSQDVIARLNDLSRRVLETPELRERLVALGTEPSPSSPAELGALLRDDLAKWTKVIRDNNIRDE